MSLPTWLFVSYGGGHVKALLPAARLAKARGLARPVYLALTTAAAEVRAAGIETLGFRDLLQPGDARALRKGEALAAALQVPAADHEESVAYLGLSYTDLEDRLGAEAAAEAYARFGRQCFLPLSVLERAIRKTAPALVVATNSPRAERAAIETARRLGVPSVCLLDLFGIWERELARAEVGAVFAREGGRFVEGRKAPATQTTTKTAMETGQSAERLLQVLAQVAARGSMDSVGHAAARRPEASHG